MEEESHETMDNRCEPTARSITHLPMNNPNDYTPYTELEFDAVVQEYCRNKNNHLKPKLEQSKSISNGNKLKQAYCTVNTPFNKIIRSCKVVVSGDVAVGKTSLIKRFGDGDYSSTHRSTIGVDFDIQRFNILDQPYTLQVRTGPFAIGVARHCQFCFFTLANQTNQISITLNESDLGHGRLGDVQMHHSGIL
jgi:hypothetical protein